MNVSVIGLGKLGNPLSEIISIHHNVIGYDIISSGSIKECATSEYIFVVVPTPHDDEYDGSNITSNLPPRDFDYSIVKEVFFNLNKYLKITQNVILVSTVLPGTMKTLKPLLKCNLYYSPFLVSLDQVKFNIVSPELLMIGGEDCDKIIELYKTFSLCERYVTGTYEEIELMKMSVNTILSMKITFANTLQDISQKIGNIDIDKITRELATTYFLNNTEFTTAGLSAGGPCLPRDVIAMKWFAKEYNLGYDFFGFLRDIQEQQTKNLADYLTSLSFEHDLPIVILGKQYKENVEYDYGSPSILISKFCNCTFDDLSKPAVFLTTNDNKYDFPEGSVVVDILREREGAIHYGKR